MRLNGKYLNDVLIPFPDMTNNYQRNENEVIHYLKPSLPKALIFDTKDLT